MKKIIVTAAMLGTLSISANIASADTPALANLRSISLLAVSTGCTTCHTGASTTALGSGGTSRNLFGIAFEATSPKANGYVITTAQWDALKVIDSDNDTTNNLTEITNGTDPGTATTTTTTTTTPTTTDTSSSGGGCVTSAATTPLMMILAMLSLGFFVRRKKS